MIHGIQPGPLLFEAHGDIVYGVFTAMILSSFFMSIWSFGAMRLFIRILKVPKNYLFPIIVVLCSVGAYALDNQVFDLCFYRSLRGYWVFIRKIKVSVASIYFRVCFRWHI